MITGIIYEFRNTINNKYYVGQTIRPDLRYNEHKAAQGDTLFHRAIRKYGFDKFEYTVVNQYSAADVYELKNILNDAEIKQIDYRDSYNNGYNMNRGGEGQAGYTHTSEAVEKNKISNQINDLLTFGFKPPRNNSGINNGMYGKHHSEETKQKLRERALAREVSGAKGYKWTDEQKQRLSEIKKNISEQTRQKMSAAKKGKHWKLVDGKRVLY